MPAKQNNNGLKKAAQWIITLGAVFVVLWSGFSWAFRIRADTDTNTTASASTSEAVQVLKRIHVDQEKRAASEEKVKVTQRHQCKIGLLARDWCYTNGHEWKPRQ